MAKKVSFGMFWQSYGRQEITLPDTVDANNTLEILKYIKSVWDDIPVPEGSYVPDSDELDEESLIEVYDDQVLAP